MTLEQGLIAGLLALFVVALGLLIALQREGLLHNKKKLIEVFTGEHPPIRFFLLSMIYSFIVFALILPFLPFLLQNMDQ